MSVFVFEWRAGCRSLHSDGGARSLQNSMSAIRRPQQCSTLTIWLPCGLRAERWPNIGREDKKGGPGLAATSGGWQAGNELPERTNALGLHHTWPNIVKS